MGWTSRYLFELEEKLDKLEDNLAKLLHAAQKYIKDLEGHEGAEGFSDSTRVAAAEYYDVLTKIKGETE
jgi:hypothetical protein